MDRSQDILEFWFQGITDETSLSQSQETTQRWFKADDEFDAEICENFSTDLNKAMRGEYNAWHKEAKSLLSLIIILDQFSRNIYRGTADAFESDLLALEKCFLAIKNQYADELSLVEQQFLYLPLMHSENITIQDMSLKYYSFLLSKAQKMESANVEYFENVLEFAKQHHEIVKIFDRFPHRNKILKRRSTSSEVAFLQESGHTFG